MASKQAHCWPHLKENEQPTQDSALTPLLARYSVHAYLPGKIREALVFDVQIKLSWRPSLPFTRPTALHHERNCKGQHNSVCSWSPSGTRRNLHAQPKHLSSVPVHGSGQCWDSGLLTPLERLPCIGSEGGPEAIASPTGGTRPVTSGCVRMWGTGWREWAECLCLP